MAQDQIQDLERQAQEFYQAGEYQKAKGLWQRVLEMDPGNARAAEGLRMASLLSDNWDFFAQEGGTDDSTLRHRLAEAEHLADGGHFREALAVISELEGSFPGAEEVARSKEAIQHAFEMAPFVDEQLTVARKALADGRHADVTSACEKVLALDPAHRKARLILEELDLAGSPSAPPRPASGSDEDLPILELVPEPEEAGAGQDDAGPSPEPPPARADEAPAPALDLDWALAESTPSPPAEAASSPQPPGEAPPVPAPTKPDPAPGPPAAAPGAAGGDPRVADFVEQGHPALEESRFAEAIDSLSRALALDEEHAGAASLLEKARAGLAANERVAETKYVEACDLLDEGRLDEAEPLLMQVLTAVPGHPAAAEALERIREARQDPPPPAEPPAAPVPEGAVEADEVDDLLGISPGQVDFGSEPTDAVPIGVGAPASTAGETEEEFIEGSLPSGLGEGTDLEGEPPLVEAPPRKVRRGLSPVAAVVFLLLAGGAAGGWIWRDRLLPLVGLGGSASGEESAGEARAGLGAEPATAATISAEDLEALGRPEAVEPEAPAPRAEPPAVARVPAGPDLRTLLESARRSVRDGRGREAMKTLESLEGRDESDPRVQEVRQSARWMITARDAFAEGDFESSLRALYRLESKADPSLRPRNVEPGPHAALWNFLVLELEQGHPWRVLDLTNPSRGELQLRGRERDTVAPLIELARRWQYESPRRVSGPEYQAEVRAFRRRGWAD